MPTDDDREGYSDSIYRSTFTTVTALTLPLFASLGVESQEPRVQEETETRYEESEDQDTLETPSIVVPSDKREYKEEKISLPDILEFCARPYKDLPESYQRTKEALDGELVYDRELLFQEIKEELEDETHDHREGAFYDEGFNREKAQRMDITALNQLYMGIKWMESNPERIRDLALKEIRDRLAVAHGIDEEGRERRFLYPFHRAEAGGGFSVEEEFETRQDLQMDLYHPELWDIGNLERKIVNMWLDVSLEEPLSFRDIENSIYMPSSHYLQAPHLMTLHSHISGSPQDTKYTGPSIADLRSAHSMEMSGWTLSSAEYKPNYFGVNIDFYTMNFNVVDVMTLWFPAPWGSRDIPRVEVDQEPIEIDAGRK